jgi:hypothetical protein
MRKTRLFTVAAALALTLAVPAALADSTQAHCEMWHKGDHKKEASGTCQFSQRQGYIDIRLHNGSSFNLSPGDKADHFRDQEGHRVRRHNEDGQQVYTWEHRTIKVAFGSGHHGAGHNDARTPRDLSDLVGQTGGHAEDQLRARGYNLANSSHSGENVYSNWKHKHGGQCVTVHSVNGHYKSIVYAPEFDCR